MRIAMVGTRGVPARYGGFETCIEEVGSRLASRGHEVTVYCRTTDPDVASLAEHLGMRLVFLPALRKRSLETLTHSALSIGHLVSRRAPDAALVFNAANSVYLPALRARGVPVATHVDGLEWRRAKWSGAGKAYYRRAEELAVRWSDALIADAQGIADYYDEEFGAPTQLIAYGAPLQNGELGRRIDELGLSTHGYHVAVARVERENHVDVIVDGYVRSDATLPLIVVGDAPYAEEYVRRVRSLAKGDPRVLLLGSVWDQDLLDSLYRNAFVYWHGHSVGGTNPSLLRAVGAGAPTNAYDVVFNREVLGDTGRFWSTADDVAALLVEAEADPAGTTARGAATQERATLYDWDRVALQYEALCEGLADGRLRRSPGVTGHRRNAPGWGWPQDPAATTRPEHPGTTGGAGA